MRLHLVDCWVLCYYLGDSWDHFELGVQGFGKWIAEKISMNNMVCKKKERETFPDAQASKVQSCLQKSWPVSEPGCDDACCKWMSWFCKATKLLPHIQSLESLQTVKSFQKFSAVLPLLQLQQPFSKTRQTKTNATWHGNLRSSSFLITVYVCGLNVRLGRVIFSWGECAFKQPTGTREIKK